MPAPPPPRLALVIGDPAGIGPELAARLLADAEVRAAARLVVIGDRRVLAHGAAVAGVPLHIRTLAAAGDPLPEGAGLLDLGHLDPAGITEGVASAAGGKFALANFRAGLRLAADGSVGGVFFTPFNKAAMHLAHSAYADEIGFVSEVLGISVPASEFNILGNLWNARVTSHVPLADVAPMITRERVLRGIVLTHGSLVASGMPAPRIGVAGLNPHAGDGGNFGHEEEREIAPAIAAARAQGIDATGPYPADTVFVRATNGAFDAVLTMYHDQGQIAMKLLGFDKGVTLMGGFPFPITTPSHGSAYDIAGKGVANPGASRNALLLAARMAA